MLPWNTALQQQQAARAAEGEPGELLITAFVLKETLLKMTDIPLVFRAPSIPERLAAKTQVQLAVIGIDLLDLSLQTRYIATLADNDENNTADEADLDDYLTDEALAEEAAKNTEAPVTASEPPLAAETGGGAAC